MKNNLLNSLGMKTVFAILLFSCVSIFSSSNLNAQAKVTDGLYAVPQGNFVHVDVAITRLDVELLAMKILLEQLPHGSQPYNEMEAKYAYYESMVATLMDSKSNEPSVVAGAIATGLGIFASDYYSNFSKQFKAQLKQGAIDLLEQ